MGIRMEWNGVGCVRRALNGVEVVVGRVSSQVLKPHSGQAPSFPPVAYAHSANGFCGCSSYNLEMCCVTDFAAAFLQKPSKNLHLFMKVV